MGRDFSALFAHKLDENEIYRFTRTLNAGALPDNAAKESGVIDFIWDGDARDIDVMRQWLLDNCGEPSPTLRGIYREFEDYADSDGYYIDDFKDLKAR